jgi:hypothetical protein
MDNGLFCFLFFFPQAAQLMTKPKGAENKEKGPD